MSAVDLKGLLASAGDEHERWARTINPQFVRILRTIGFDRTWARAEGPYLYDGDGNRYLDMLGGFGMYNVGRNNPRIRAALIDPYDFYPWSRAPRFKDVAALTEALLADR